MGKVRIKDKKHLEEIFKRFAEAEGDEFNSDLIIEGNSDLTFGQLIETCEALGYENLLLEQDFVEDPQSHCDTFYIDIIGIKKIKIDIEGNRNDFVWFFGGRRAEELTLEGDGTMRIYFD